MAKSKPIMQMSTQEIVEKLISGDRVMLGKAITLVESRLPEHQEKGDALLVHLQKRKIDSLRIAVSGAPGVGKSAFIEALGVLLADKGHKVAVLSIDPSSDSRKGSILGDKTRMEKLSVHDNAFIRPSPAGDFLGGIAWRTREAITICEAAGYNIVFVETVGVGQSEFKVKHMVDCFTLLLSPGGGDDLQGIKRGIVEMADVLAVTKCDGDLKDAALRTRKDYSQALHLFPEKENGWTPKVLALSSITGEGVEDIWETIQQYKDLVQSNDHFETNRNNQNLHWFKERLAMGIRTHVEQWLKSSEAEYIEENIINGSQNPIIASHEILKLLVK